MYKHFLSHAVKVDTIEFYRRKFTFEDKDGETLVKGVKEETVMLLNFEYKNIYAVRFEETNCVLFSDDDWFMTCLYHLFRLCKYDVRIDEVGDFTCIELIASDGGITPFGEAPYVRVNNTNPDKL